MVNLRCPVCAGALEKRAGAYLCPKNHSFDIAKSGYVNLLLNSSQGHHGDDKLMVRARRDFLDKGYYDRFIAAVADAAAEFTPPEATVLDAGCGEGIYSLAVLRAIEKAGKHGELLGVDISKTALQYASKRSPDFTLCVASCAHLPVEDGSVDEVLNIFSPFVPEEFARVLKRSGYLLRAYPLREHLWELKALIYDTPRDNPPTPLEPHPYFCKMPKDVAERDVMIVDPMLATGGSACEAIGEMVKRGCKHITLMVLVAAPEGIKAVQEKYPDVNIYAGALDDHLNEHGYIVPGLGDAGDRIFGTK